MSCAISCKKNGIDPDQDVKIEFVQENEELAALMDSGKAAVAMVPEPTATTVLAKNTSIRRALDMTAEWDKVADGKLMMGCVIVRNEFLKNHPDAVRTFMTDYEASVKAASDIDTTAALCETAGIIPKAAVAKQAIPGCNLTFTAGGNDENPDQRLFCGTFRCQSQIARRETAR